MEKWVEELLAVVIVIACMVHGAHQGLVRKLYSLVRGILYFIGAAVAAMFFYAILPAAVPYREAVAAAAAFVVTGMVLNLVAKAINIVNYVPVVNKLNKLGGAILGAVYGIILLWIMTLVYKFLQGENVYAYIQDYFTNFSK